MTLHLTALSVDALDPVGLARFWAGVLGWDTAPDGTTLLPDRDAGFAIRFLPTDVPKAGPNQIHLDVTSTSEEDQRERVSTALRLGGSHLDVGQRGDEGHVVLGDPEGNELCVIEPGNRFLAGCGRVGAVNCDGTQQVGYFWSEALGWPLVWDQDQETAIQSPHGGPKITWSGPPVRPRTGGNRCHLDVSPPPDGDLVAEADRLLALGATRLDRDGDGAGRVAMADPDGNELCLLAPR